MLLKNPNEISEDVKLAGLIYGQPGVGKTTLALSAPGAVLIDADKGLRRVEKRFQVPSLPLNDFKDVLALFQGDELAPFSTVVFDTLGKLVDRMGEYLIRENTKNGNGKGGLSMQGWGILKLEFQNLLKLAQSKGKHLIFVAHEREEKDGDTRIVRPDVSGSSGKDLVKDLDFMGYMEMRGSKRTISFSPSEKYYAKNSLRLDPVIEVPDTAAGNSFIQTIIIDRTRERMKQDDIENQKYVALVDQLETTVNGVKDAATANAALEAIDKTEVIWDSQRIAKHSLNEKIKALGLHYDKAKKAFVAADAATAAPTPQQPPAAVQQPAQAAQEPTPEPPAPPSASPAINKWTTLVDGLINGFQACASAKALGEYANEQSDDINAVTLKGDPANRDRLFSAMDEIRKRLAPKKAA